MNFITHDHLVWGAGGMVVGILIGYLIAGIGGRTARRSLLAAAVGLLTSMPLFSQRRKEQ